MDNEPVFKETTEPLSAPVAKEGFFPTDKDLPIIGFDGEGSVTVDEVLDKHHRLGGPSEAGWHSWEEAARCPRADKLIQQGRTGNDSSYALQLGSIFHEFMAKRYACFTASVPVEARAETLKKVSEDVDATVADLESAGHGLPAKEALRLFRLYEAYYRSACEVQPGSEPSDNYTKDYTVVAVEKHFQRSLPWGDPYTGRADLILRGPDGYVIVDHKTSGREDADFLEGWVLEPQMLGLAWCVSKTLRPVVAYSINGIIKTQTPKFKRLFFAVTKRLTNDWLEMMRYFTTMRRLAAMAGSPPNFSQCIRRYGRCQFWDACAYGHKSRDL